jgi:glycosyltransferase involved in cell wall biosynthesis
MLSKFSAAILDFDDSKNPLLGAGQAMATVELGKRLAQKGHTITVICSRYPGSKDRYENGMYYKHIGLGTRNLRLNNIAYILSLPFVLPFVRKDVVLECFTAPISTLGSPLYSNKPVIAIPTSFDALRFSQQYGFPFHKVEKILIKYYKYFLPFTLNIAKKIKDMNPDAQFKIVPNGVSSHFFTLPVKKGKHILFMGRLEMNQKGIDLLLQAVAEVENKLKLPILLAGDGPDKNKVKELIQKYHLSQRVKMIGTVKGAKKDQLLAESALVLVPSREESFCLVALEALACGVPVLAFNIPGLSWARTTGVIKVPAYSIHKYAQQMIELTKRDTKNAAKSIRAFAQKFSWDETASKYEEYIYSILKAEV